jgi:hypothetical protein
MMNVVPVSLVCSLAAAALLVACAGGSTTDLAQGCGSPPPSAPPGLWLVYPIPDATAVPDALGSLVFASGGGLNSQDTITLVSASGSVTAGSFTAPPSPVPSPHVTPGSEFSGNVSYVAAPIPTLSPATTYTINFTYPDWADEPPSCSAPVTRGLGSFTTQ